MKIKLIIDIAIALLMARWKQTLVAAIGVTFSITMFISLLGFMNGLNGLLDGLILNRTPHVRLYKDIKPNPIQPVNLALKNPATYNFISSIKPSLNTSAIANASAIIRALKEDNRVVGVAPKINAQVLFNAGVIDINGIISGIDAAEESRLFNFDDYIIKGKAMDINNYSNSILLGKGVADKLLAELGDVVQATTATGEQVSLKVSWIISIRIK